MAVVGDWIQHGPDWKQTRGVWVLLVRKLSDGWDYAIHYRNIRIVVSKHLWDTAYEAKEACCERAYQLGHDLMQVPE